MKHHHSVESQVKYFEWIKTLSEGLPLDHPIRTVHATMRSSFVSIDRTTRSAGYHPGVWQIFIPPALLYIEMRYTGDGVKAHLAWGPYRDALIPFGYTFRTTSNYAEALLWTMDALGIGNPLARRDLTILKSQITGVRMLLKRQQQRILRARKTRSEKKLDELLKKESKGVS